MVQLPLIGMAGHSTIQAESDEAGYLIRAAMSKCLSEGTRCSPRGMDTLECVMPTVLVLRDPSRPFFLSPIRRANYRFGLVEAAWILSGSDALAPLARVNKHMTKFSDDGRRLWGAYGPRLVGQLPHVLSTLRRDRDSRQAVITTWRPMVAEVACNQDDENAVSAGIEGMGPGPSPDWDGASWRSKDVPCTVAWHFMIRRDLLHLTVFMRSNDVWLGLPYDLLSFTTVQRAVAACLGVGLGPYCHVVSSLHLYAEHADQASRACSTPCLASLSMPPLPDWIGLGTERLSLEFSNALKPTSPEPDHPGMLPFWAATLGQSGRCELFDQMRVAAGRGRLVVD